MGALQKKPYLTEQEYLAFEEASDVKHEYVDGEIYAMAGASLKHNLITGNLFFNLRAVRRKGGKCRVFSSDMKCRIEDGIFYYYPDVILDCGTIDGTAYYTQQPCLIGEVLSKSTARNDRTEKWFTYKKIPSLRYYLLADSLQKKVDYFVRNELGEWFYAELEEGETLTIECDDFHAVLTLADIYEDVVF